LIQEPSESTEDTETPRVKETPSLKDSSDSREETSIPDNNSEEFTQGILYGSLASGAVFGMLATSHNKRPESIIVGTIVGGLIGSIPKFFHFISKQIAKK